MSIAPQMERYYLTVAENIVECSPNAEASSG
jgi:hypothetical protein